jgi:hypothetical protein
MDVSKSIAIDGYKVYCNVIALPSGQFKIEVATYRKDADQAKTICEPPHARFYEDQAEAEKNAHFILKGIKQVLPGGKPHFTLG